MNWSALVCLLVPSVVVTVTLTVPTPSAGDEAVRTPLLLMVTEPDSCVPKWTASTSPGTMYVPAIVTLVPPFVLPFDGLTEVTVGRGEP